MSWQSQDWVQDDSNFYGYPTPILSDIVYDPDHMENMIWIITATSVSWFNEKRKRRKRI